ncbi:MAG: NADH dehydrogenase I, E subunit [uncultured bacterium]|nr:MAG: NADH dehydrogenase I, E subunit [uncultured bacterium]
MTTVIVENVLSKYKNPKRDDLIPILQKVQDELGYLSKDAVVSIGKALNLPASKIYGVATFYNQFRFKPLGKYHIQVCRGTACHVKGSFSILERVKSILKISPDETTRDGLFSLEVVACIGACGLAPVICVNGEFYANLTADSIAKIIDSFKDKEKKETTNE